MTDKEQKQIFSKNLNKYLANCNKTQKEVADAIQVSPQTFNTWSQGIALPRMGKVQRLADFFGIGKSDLIEDKGNALSEYYYYNEDTREIAQKVFESKELKLLFDEAKNASSEDIETAYNMLLALKRKERGGS